MMDTNSIVTGITTYVADAVKHYKEVQKDDTLGKYFHEAGRGLGLIKDVLERPAAEQPPVNSQVQPDTETTEHEVPQPAEDPHTQSSTKAGDTRPPTDTAQEPSADSLLKDCYKDAKLLRDLFQKISEVPPEMRLKSYEGFLEKNGKHNLVQTLVLNLMENLCRLAKYEGVEEGSLKDLRDAITKLKSMKSSYPEVPAKGAYSFSNNSTGTQYNTAGGTQNNATGNGTSLFGTNFHAPVTFSGTKI